MAERGATPRPSNPYAPPRSRLVHADGVARSRWIFAAGVLAGLATLWWLNVPRAQVGEWIASAMPWPVHPTRIVKWTALFTERLLIESAVCIPAAALLAGALPARQALAASALALEQWMRSFTELLLAPTGNQAVYLAMALVLQTLLLVAVTAWLAARRRGAGAG